MAFILIGAAVDKIVFKSLEIVLGLKYVKTAKKSQNLKILLKQQHTPRACY